ncbi:MAG: TetR family transcriptional regulator [Piscirickettsiaceae bacterium CG_4_10_14_3_um_filter_44_349]|nr:MAG: TetR family transcriptional regulator [Piscirickettsiaceae bacterium CG18_big_fil_WC_8_21_14_2_50_44_103]PIX79826.1 MAG: TetR family transcriptional regulator [Piscirickettsiaceae bacterium CG_4_10_14_3_um_filter_44_349]PIY75986.1 MAG: TetR family transcriptional regulator [Piscirickettsiaceae bacterium CG_4_10_14_0_8_um_filter_44_742]
MANATEKEIRNALIRLKHGRPKVVDKKRKISISALAEEAGVSDSTIHNRYPEVAAEVREIIGKEHKTQRDEKNEQLKSEKLKNKELREYIEQLESDIRRLTSINATLNNENAQLKAEMASGKVVRINQK